MVQHDYAREYIIRTMNENLREYPSSSPYIELNRYYSYPIVEYNNHIESIISIDNEEINTERPRRHQNRLNLEQIIMENINLPNYNIPHIQEQLEERRRTNHPQYHYDTDLIDHILHFTKGLGKEHNQDYFERQAIRMTGSPNPELSSALAGFQQGIENMNFGLDYMTGFLKQETVLTDEELSRYALKLDLQQDNSKYGNHFRNKYFDTKFNFCLTYDGELIASVGFDASDGRMFIGQIQGISRNKEKLGPLKWERALASYAVEWAEEHGIPEVAIVSVDNNHWANTHGHLDRKQGKMLYDVTARRIGLRDRDKDGNYVKKLEIEPEIVILPPIVHPNFQATYI